MSVLHFVLALLSKGSQLGNKKTALGKTREFGDQDFFMNLWIAYIFEYRVYIYIYIFQYIYSIHIYIYVYIFCMCINCSIGFLLCFIDILKRWSYLADLLFCVKRSAIYFRISRIAWTGGSIHPPPAFLRFFSPKQNHEKRETCFRTSLDLEWL